MPQLCSSGSGGHGARGRDNIAIGPYHHTRQKKEKSLFICNHCGTDTRKTDDSTIKKVVVGDYANMLCYSCKMLLEDSIQDVAKKFLR